MPRSQKEKDRHHWAPCAQVLTQVLFSSCLLLCIVCGSSVMCSLLVVPTHFKWLLAHSVFSLLKKAGFLAQSRSLIPTISVEKLAALRKKLGASCAWSVLIGPKRNMPK